MQPALGVAVNGLFGVLYGAKYIEHMSQYAA
jgi:hypothetical protein